MPNTPLYSQAPGGATVLEACSVTMARTVPGVGPMRLVQLQNLPQNHIEDLDEARELAKKHDLDIMEVIYDNLHIYYRSLYVPRLSPPKGTRSL